MSIIKNFGKFRQWTNEKLGHAGRTDTSDDFKTLQHDTDERKDLTEKLHAVLKKYIKTLSTKKVVSGSTVAGVANPVTIQQADKQMLLATLGSCMTRLAALSPPDMHTASESDYAKCLMECGQTQEKLADFQHQYLARMQTGYFVYLDSLVSEFNEYAQLKKKLESRRLDFDAKLNKVQKSKKEKPEWEEEMRAAQCKYEETLVDIQARMQSLSGSEDVRMNKLVSFIEAQMSYFQSSLNTLQQLQATLATTCNTHLDMSHTDSNGLDLQRNSTISTASSISLANSVNAMGTGGRPAVSRQTHSRRDSSSNISNFSQDRSPSITTINGANHSNGSRLARETSSDRLSLIAIANNASNATSPSSLPPFVPSVAPSPAAQQQSRRIPLVSQHTGSDATSAGFDHSVSKGSMVPPIVPRRSISPEPLTHLPASRPAITDTRKRVLVQHDFTAEGPDELTIVKDDIIIVLEEIDEGWWIGEIGEQRGMFPANYTVPITSATPLPSQPASAYTSRQPSPDRLPPIVTAPISGHISTPVTRSNSAYAIPKSASINSYLAGSQFSPHVPSPATALPVNGQPTAATAAPCSTCGCQEFTENVFKRGQCNNCFHKH